MVHVFFKDMKTRSFSTYLLKNVFTYVFTVQYTGSSNLVFLHMYTGVLVLESQSRISFVVVEFGGGAKGQNKDNQESLPSRLMDISKTSVEGDPFFEGLLFGGASMYMFTDQYYLH